MPKLKPHKGLLKRIRITRTGKIKMSRAFGRHLRSHKPASLLRTYRRPNYASKSDVRRLSNMLGLSVRAAGRPSAGSQESGSAES